MRFATTRLALDRKILALWTHPRSLSSAFARMMSQHHAVDLKFEPFLKPYYFGPHRRSTRHAEEMPSDRNDFTAVLKRLQRQQYKLHWNQRKLENLTYLPGMHTAGRVDARHIFIKDFSNHVIHHIADGGTHPNFLDSFHSAFLTRHPRFAIPSLYRRLPDFSLSGTFFVKYHKLRKYIVSYQKN